METKSNHREAPASLHQAPCYRKTALGDHRCQRFTTANPSEVLVLIHIPRLAARAKAEAQELLPAVARIREPEPTEVPHPWPKVRIHTAEDWTFDGRTLDNLGSQVTFTPVYTSVLHVAHDGRSATYLRVEDGQLLKAKIESPTGFTWTEEGTLKRDVDGACYPPTSGELEAGNPSLGARATSEIEAHLWVRVCTLAENAAEQHRKS